jgi:hypothetical protein
MRRRAQIHSIRPRQTHDDERAARIVAALERWGVLSLG